MKEFKLKSSDGKTNLACYAFEPEGEPKCVLQLIHGMCEYVLRYVDFIKYLNEQGIIVVADDHIGHGYSVEFKSLYGYFGPQDGWIHMVEDEHLLRLKAQEMYPGLPYIMMGHSMGSFIARAYLTMCPSAGLAGCIMMATSAGVPELPVGIALVKALRKKQGDFKHSRLVTALAFGKYNSRVKNPVNFYGWLTHDEDYCLRIAEDPMYGFMFTLAGYEDLFKMLSYINSYKWFAFVPQDLPMFICSGTEDPVGAYGEGVKEIVSLLEDTGCTALSFKLYEGFRHELLNEIGKEEPMKDISDFIQNCLSHSHGNISCDL